MPYLCRTYRADLQELFDLDPKNDSRRRHWPKKYKRKGFREDFRRIPMLPSLIDLANEHGVSTEVVQFALDEIADTSGDPPSHVEAASPPLPVRYLDLPDMDTKHNPAESQAEFGARLRLYTEEHTRVVQHNKAEQKRFTLARRAYTDYQAYLQAAHRYEQMIATDLKSRLPAAAARFHVRREAMRLLTEGGAKGKQGTSKMLPPPVNYVDDSVDCKSVCAN